MLLRENYTAEHILRLRNETGADPSILERTIFAFGLLEAIRSVNMPFIFKGGTALMVLLDEPRRLSKANYNYMYDRFVRNSIGRRLLKDITYSDIKYYYYHLINER